MPVKVLSDHVKYTDTHIEAEYSYQTTKVQKSGETIKCTPTCKEFVFRTLRKVPKTCLAMVGWGGNNGSTITGMILANRNKVKWETKDGYLEANYWGSLTQASTFGVGVDQENVEAFASLKDMVPMIDPNNLVIDGWDISKANLADSAKRAKVLPLEVQKQIQSQMEAMIPRKAIYDPSFIASNQESRADNVWTNLSKKQQVEKIRADLQDMKKQNPCVIVFWTANTERFCDVKVGIHDTAANLLDAIQRNEKEISPSTLYAVASVLEKCAFINGSPQNTFVPGLVEFAVQNKVPIVGDDLKSGQTKLKSVLVDFLVSAGIKPVSIVSYNHLGNNDGSNLSETAQFRSKEISKSNVVDDMVRSNNILYKPGEKPDHCVVIKYVPYVGDSKRAMDEYISEIAMGGRNTIITHNTCEDSLLAAPIILDLVILTEFFQRVAIKEKNQPTFTSFHPVFSILSYLCKAPLVPRGTPLVNALSRQRSCIENVIRACIGLPPNNHMLLEFKIAPPAMPESGRASHL